MDLLTEQKRTVPRAFDVVSGTYDFLTGLNPGYNEHLALSAQRMAVEPEARLLDLCCGTGLSTQALRDAYPRASITALDASQGMIDQAREKPLAESVEFLVGDAMDPAASEGVSGRYDGILMAYGIRNMPDPDLCLERVYDLLEPGAVICFHEYSVRDSLRTRALWNAVAFGVIIPGGLLTAPTSGIYRYLRRSVLEFDGVTAFEARLRRHGFVDVRTEAMDGWQKGIVHSFLARRPSA